MRVLWFKRRDYPIKRDEDGRSLRQQAFELFGKGCRPAQISKEELVPTTLKTLYRYYEDWKKQKHKLPDSTLKEYMRKNPEFSEKWIKMLADYFEVTPQDIILRMQKPWGIMRLTKGELPDKRMERSRSEIEGRLEAALRIIHLGEMFRNSPEQITQFILEIVGLRDNTRLVIEKTNGQAAIRKENIEIKHLHQEGTQSVP